MPPKRCPSAFCLRSLSLLSSPQHPPGTLAKARSAPTTLADFSATCVGDGDSDLPKGRDERDGDEAPR